MNLLKMFFDDEDSKVGLCGFETLIPKYSTAPIRSDSFFNPIVTKKLFQTNFQRNTLLL